MLEWIRTGYKIPFVCADSTVPPYISHRNGGGYIEHAAWLFLALAEMEMLGAVGIVDKEPYCAARISVIPKSTEGKFRITTDMRGINTHVRKTDFCNETLASPRVMFDKGDWMSSLDL